jgi:hypothetical protein
MESGLTTAVLKGANAPSNAKPSMAESKAPAYNWSTDAPEFEQYQQAGTPLANNREIVHDSAECDRMAGAGNPAHVPGFSKPKAASRPRK